MHAAALVDALKRMPKTRRLTYADVAEGPALSVASVKRIFSRRDFTLQRPDDICRMRGIKFTELARAARRPRRTGWHPDVSRGRGYRADCRASWARLRRGERADARRAAGAVVPRQRNRVADRHARRNGDQHGDRQGPD